MFFIYQQNKVIKKLLEILDQENMNTLFPLTGMEETTIKGLEILYIIADLDSKQPILHKHSRDYFKPYNLVQYLFMSFILTFNLFMT